MILLLVALGLELLAPGFAEVGDQRGVKVYRRTGSRDIELGAEGDLPGTPAEVRAVLLDYANHPRWVKGLASSEIRGRGTQHLVVYQRLGLPIIADRDFTLHVTWGQAGEHLWLRFQTKNELGPPPEKGVVRVSVHEGEWRFIPIDGGKRTHALYRFHLDLAGAMPGWLGRGRALKDLAGLFEAIRDQLPRR